ncbi:MAG: ATP-binding cassette domain-containing protein [Lachnospiraceae bacterium]|nr:ATP-binding cassette domain-containing protein [Lachnospiraceae bacterium]
MKIELDNVTKKIKKTTILDSISYTFEGGKIYGLSGKNGSGKTMIMRIISGLVHPTYGEVLINNKILGVDFSFPPSIGVLINHPVFLREYTGYENLKILNSIKENKINDNQIKDLLLKVGLDSEDKRKYYKFSLGMRQRLGVAAAIMGNPDIILLDEPINAIDENGVKDIKDIIKALVSENRIIIIACHDKEELTFMADEIIYISEGKIVC